MKAKYLLTINKGILPLLFVGLVFTGFASTLPSARATSQSISTNKVNLVVSYKPTATSPVTRFSLVCSGSIITGTHPNKRSICNFLKKNKSNSIYLLSSPLKDMMCTEIYGGPEVATIMGNYNGRKVNTKYSRTNGCTISRWQEAMVFFTFPGYHVVSGNISVSPTCPGPVRIGQEASCTNPSAAGIVTFVKVGQTGVGSKMRVEALANSGFAVLIPKGEWRVSTVTPSAMSCDSLLSLFVKEKLDLTISCDTGIR